jgi:hypothetical protein
MAERHQFLDRLTLDVREHVRQIGGDPDFVDFLLGWYGLLQMDPSVTEMASLKIKTWPFWSTTRQRQVKRELQERYGPAWEERWKEAKARARSYEPPKFKGGLFSIDPQGPRPAHGPFRWNFWLALCDVKNYFTRIAKRPHWDLIVDVFFSGQEYNYAQAEWAKRQGRLSRIDHERSLNRVLSFYTTYKPVILEVLKTRVPMWASPHREHFERLHAKVAPETIFQMMTGETQVTCMAPPASGGVRGKGPGTIDTEPDEATTHSNAHRFTTAWFKRVKRV